MPNPSLSEAGSNPGLTATTRAAERSLQQAYSTSVGSLDSSEIARLLAAGDNAGAIRYVQDAFASQSGALGAAYVDGARQLATELGYAPNTLDLTRPGTIDDLSGLLQGFRSTWRQRVSETSNQILFNGMATGASPEEIARQMVEGAGLSLRDETAVRNYGRLLTAGSAEAKDREYRDMRSDGLLDSGRVIPPERIARMSDFYRRNMRRAALADSARRYAQQGVNAGRHGLLDQFIEDGWAEDSGITRTWWSVGDLKVRDSHAGVHGETVVGLDTPYSNGLMYPGDPDAPASETANCRCIETIDVKET